MGTKKKTWPLIGCKIIFFVYLCSLPQESRLTIVNVGVRYELSLKLSARFSHKFSNFFSRTFFGFSQSGDHLRKMSKKWGTTFRKIQPNLAMFIYEVTKLQSYFYNFGYTLKTKYENLSISFLFFPHFQPSKSSKIILKKFISKNFGNISPLKKKKTIGYNHSMNTML